MVFDISYVKVDHPIAQIIILQSYVFEHMEQFPNILVTGNLIFEQSIYMINKLVV